MIKVGILQKKFLEVSSFSTIFLILFVPVALAQSGFEPVPAEIQDILLRFIGLPEGFVSTIPDFLFKFTIPFLALFTIVYGIMREIRIFSMQPKLQGAIAFFMVFLTLSPSGYIFAPSLFYLIVSGALQAGAIFAFVIFMFMFFVGGLLHTMAFWHGRRAEERAAAATKHAINALAIQAKHAKEKKEELLNRRMALINSFREGSISEARYNELYTKYTLEIEKLEKIVYDILKRERAIAETH